MSPEQAISKFNLGATDVSTGIMADIICPNCGNRDGIWSDVEGRALLSQHGDCTDFQYSKGLGDELQCYHCDHSGSSDDFTVEGLGKALLDSLNLPE